MDEQKQAVKGWAEEQFEQVEVESAELGLIEARVSDPIGVSAKIGVGGWSLTTESGETVNPDTFEVMENGDISIWFNRG